MASSYMQDCVALIWRTSCFLQREVLFCEHCQVSDHREASMTVPATSPPAPVGPHVAFIQSRHSHRVHRR